MSYLDLDNLSKSFKDDKIISNLNAKIEKGEFFVAKNIKHSKIKNTLR